MEILILLAIGFAFRSTVDHVRKTRKASEGGRLKAAGKAFGGKLPKRKVKATARRHTVGWWLREAGSGFPVARAGWHAGWIAHRTEYLAHAGHREEARTRHAEAQADAAETVHDHAQRRAAAKARRDAILQQLQDSPPEGSGRRAVREAAGAVVLPFAPRERPHAPLPSDTVRRPPLKPEAEPGPYAQLGDGDSAPRLSDHVRPGDPLCESCEGTGGKPGGQCPECLGWGIGPGNPDSPVVDGAICGACGRSALPGDPVVQDGNDLTHRSHITDDIARRQDALGVNNVSADAARNPSDPAVPMCDECWLPLADEPNDGRTHERCARLLGEDYAATEIRDGRDLDDVEADLRRNGRCPWQVDPGGWHGKPGYCGRQIVDSGADEPDLFCPEHQHERDGDEDAAADEHFAHTRSLRDRDPASPATRGAPVSDTTYDSTLARSAEVSTHAEGMGSEITDRRKEIQQIADDMSAAGVGAKTVSAAMDADDAWAAADLALSAAAEAEENFAAALQSHYSDLNEATQNASDGAADPTFHEG